MCEPPRRPFAALARTKSYAGDTTRTRTGRDPLDDITAFLLNHPGMAAMRGNPHLRLIDATEENIGPSIQVSYILLTVATQMLMSKYRCHRRTVRSLQNYHLFLRRRNTFASVPLLHPLLSVTALLLHPHQHQARDGRLEPHSDAVTLLPA